MERKTRIVLSMLAGLLVVCVVAYYATQAMELGTAARQIRNGQRDADTLVKEGQFEKASQTLEDLQMLLMDEGRYQDALDVSFRIEAVSHRISDRRSPWNYLRIGEVYLALDEREKCLEWMERAVQERSFSKPEYFQHPRFEALRNLPRFQALEEACANQIGIGQEAEDFRVTLLDGSSFALAEQRGKVVLIDFWDVLCAPCRREMPNLKVIHQSHGGQDLVIIGVSLDTSRQLLEDYLAKEKLPWKIACSFDGWSDRTAVQYRISATPSTWLIDRHGIVRYHDLRGDALSRAVDALIAEP